MSSPENQLGVEGGRVWGYQQGKEHSNGIEMVLLCLFILTCFYLTMIGIARIPFDAISDNIGEGAVVCVILLLILSTPLAYGFLYVLLTIVMEFLSEKLRKIKPNPSIKFNVPGFLIVLLLLLTFAISLVVGLYQNPSDVMHGKSTDKMTEAYMDEYGYTEVNYPFKEEGETVKDANGREIEVGVFQHDEYYVLYENAEQLGEKIIEINKGTFLEGINNE